MNRLLIVSCSATKRHDAMPLPAIERYNGPFYTTLRKFQAEHPTERHQLTVLVLSAEYGLINGHRLISDYDHRLTQERADSLRPQVTGRFAAFATHRPAPFDRTFINLGRDYQRTFQIAPDLRPLLGTITEASGGIGQKRGHMRHWLEAL